MTRTWQWVIAAVALVSVVVLWRYWFWAPVTTAILVRHAEKGAVGANPNLTAAGIARADDLSQALRLGGVGAVYATDFCRTAQTAQPTALVVGLPIRIQVVGTGASALANCTPAISASTLLRATASDYADELAAHLQSAHRGATVLVVGHSDTTPALLEALGGASLCPGTFPTIGGACHIPPTEFDNVFVVSIPRLGATRYLHLRYGAPN